MQRDPMIGESAIGWILEADGPTDAPHLANAYKIRLPDIVAAEALFRCSMESSVLLGVARATAFHVAEVVFVQHHTVVLEAKAAGQFRILGELIVIDFAVFYKLRDLFIQLIRLFDVTFIKLEVHLQRLIRDPIQAAEVKLLWLI